MELSDEFIPISIEQRKLLANALRIKILHLLADTPMTSKQVADLLGETPGNVHYHIQRLYKGRLVELVDTREVSGILEKLYKSISTRFRNVSDTNPQIFSRMILTNSEVNELFSELEVVLHNWEARTARRSTEGSTEREISVNLLNVDHHEESRQEAD